MRSAVVLPNPSVKSGQILIEGEVLEAINQYRQNAPNKPEAGGILLGFRRERHIHIAKATIPQKEDKRNLFRFDRMDKRHQLIATQYWRKSGEMMDYIGEWHTHPEISPTPSSLDVAEWRKICITRGTPMVFMILGMYDIQWVGIGRGRNIFKCGEEQG